MSVLFPPVVLLRSVLALAVLKLPVVCYRVQRDRWPCCSPPVVLSKKANTPVAVLFAPVVLFKSAPGACYRVGICGVGKKRPSADGRIEAADFVVDREATNGWVVCSAREIKKCVLPLRGIAAYIASSDGGLTASDVSKTEK